MSLKYQLGCINLLLSISVPKIKPEKPNVASVGHNAIGLSWTPVSAVDITGYMVITDSVYNL